MTLANLQDAFLEATGRQDLYQGAQATNDKFFLNAGMRYLDVKKPSRESTRWYKQDVAAGGHSLEFSYARSIKEVWVSKVDTRYLLTRRSPQHMKFYHGYTEPVSGMDWKAPSDWAPMMLPLSPEQEALTSSDYTDEFTYGHEEIIWRDSGYAIRGIFWLPPLDELYTVEVYASFWSETLTDASDTNYWATEYPEAVVASAVLALERFYRNLEGYQAQLFMLNDIMKGQEEDIIEEEIYGRSMMEG